MTNGSWWMTSAPGRERPSLDGDRDADVVVLGAGIAGLTTAWQLTQAGRQVTVVEADRLVAGVTGYTTAKVTAQHNLVYRDLTDKHGADAARNYARSQQLGLQLIRDTAATHGIECELESVPSLVYTESDADLETLQAEQEAAQAAGLDMQMVDKAGLPGPIRAGLLLADQAQFHPRRYLLGVADLVEGAGGLVLERTRALDVHEDDGRQRVETDRGTITCGDVVVATHYPFLDRGMLFAKLAAYRDCVVTAAIDAGDDPGLTAISTGSEPGGTHSIRTAPLPDGRRLLIATGGQHRTGSDDSEGYEELRGWLQDRFPRAELRQQWSTQDTSSADRLPFIGRLPHAGDRIWVATGFSAWGMTNGTFAGLLLSDLITGKANDLADTYDPSRSSIGSGATKMVKENAHVASSLVKGVVGARAADVDQLQPGQADVFLRPRGRVATYRDDEGALHCVSARCTHLGCTVAWNSAERSWDCPCHGSRFDLDGKVLQGPAVQDLERLEAEGR